MLGSFSPKIRGLRFLPSALGASIVHAGNHLHQKELKGIVGWGVEKDTRRASAFARQKALPYYTLEAGFIRAIRPDSEPFSFIIDNTGIYYDATRPSELEQLIVNCPAPNPQRAEALIQRIVAEKISTCNHCRQEVNLPESDKPKVLLVDQAVDDPSIAYGLSDQRSFERMLTVARQTYPDALFVIIPPPEVIAGKRSGFLSSKLPINLPAQNILVLTKDCNPFDLLAKVDHVFTVTSHLGFEALMTGKKVSCFGMPFYAGWGLTDDHVICERRRTGRTLIDLFSAAYLTYTRYVDPITAKPCRLERILDLIKSHHQGLSKSKKDIFCFGFQLWNKGVVRRFLSGSSLRIYFVNSVGQARIKGINSNCRILIRKAELNPEIEALANEFGLDVEHFTDGFIQSVGLRADSAHPSSVIIDSRGVYFDGHRPSALEELLNNVTLDLEGRERSRILRQTISAACVSHKNEQLTIRAKPEQTVILIPGQIEDDDSLRLGCVDISTNLALLSEVRSRNPSAYIIYKPHPKVVVGKRKGGIAKEVLNMLCDQVVFNQNISACIDKADQVHTMTSIAGFEALLRGKRVFTYGLPFYAGWGLTVDRHAIPRRRRRCTIDELVYCSLVLYPMYYHWGYECFVAAEDILCCPEERHHRSFSIFPVFYGQRLFRKAVFLFKDYRAVRVDA